MYLISYIDHQSIKSLMAGHLGINVNVASTVFRKGCIPVLEFLCEALGVRNAHELSSLPRLQARISEHLKNVVVVTTHRGETKQRFKAAKISDKSAASMRFVDHEGREKSIASYFKDMYNKTLMYPDLPLVLKANGTTAFPLECLEIAPSQRFTKRLSAARTAEMIRATLQKPPDRASSISDAVRTTTKHNENPYMKSFGMVVDTKMMEVDARILPAPRVIFANNKSLEGKNGKWNMKGVRLVDAPAISSYAFVFFARIDTRTATEIRDTIVQKWIVAGMNIQGTAGQSPLLVVNPAAAPDNIKGGLSHAFKQANEIFKKRCQLIVCIIDEEFRDMSHKDVYKSIKFTSLVEAGVVTQCMQLKHVRTARSIKDQYIANVALVFFI